MHYDDKFSQTPPNASWRRASRQKRGRFGEPHVVGAPRPLSRLLGLGGWRG